MRTNISTKKYSQLQRFIFISFEGSTYQPNSESQEPDIENMQVIWFMKWYSRRDAFDKFLQYNSYIKDTSFDEVRCMRLSDWWKYDCMFYLKD